ncbi:MAG: TlpA disulfide reductase family protein [Bacteroidales bacterium]
MSQTIKKRLQSGIIFTLAMMFLAMGCRDRTDEANASISIKVSSSRGETIFLEKVTLDGPALMDSAKLNQQGEASFSVYIDDFDFFMVHDRSGERILLLVEKGEEAEIYTRVEAFEKDYTVRGSGGSVLLLDLEQKKNKTLAELDSLGQIWIKERYTDDNITRKEFFDSLASGIVTEHKRALGNFIERYPESPAGIIAMYQVLRTGEPLFTYEQDIQVFMKVSESLEAKYPSNPHVRDFARRTGEYQDELDAWQQREALLQPGSIPPPVELFDIRGEKVTLADHAGKYVLLYFWDARKRECWDINAKLVPLYQKFRYKGFEVMGIYTGSDRQLLFNAVRVDGLPWIHLFGNSAVEKQYNVRSVPEMLLIDRDGKVLYRSTNVEELWQKLPWLVPGSGIARDSAAVTTQFKPKT